MRTRDLHAKIGQFTLIIGVFILMLVIILTLSLYMIWKYLKNSAEKRLLNIRDLSNYEIVLENLTIKNSTTIIEVKGQLDKVLSGTATCINITSRGYLNSTRTIKVINNEISVRCVANDSISLSLLYDNYRRQRIVIRLSPRYYRTLLNIEGSNMTLNGELTIRVNVFYGTSKIYSIEFVHKIPSLTKIYNTDLVYALDIPRADYDKLSKEIMYISENIRNICLKENYCYINESIRYRIAGNGICRGLHNISLLGTYPELVSLSKNVLGNCSVDTMLTIMENISKTYLREKDISSINMTLARLLSLNQIIYNAETGLFSIQSCSKIGNNIYNCSIFPEFEFIPLISYLYFELNNTGLSLSNISLVRAFFNGDLVINLYIAGEETATANLIAYLYAGYIEAIPVPFVELELFNLTVSCTPATGIGGVYFTCSANLRTYNVSSNLYPAFAFQVPINLLLEYYSTSFSRTTILLDYRNITLIPLS